MTKNYELEQEFDHYAKLSDCNAIIKYAASLFKEEELFEFMADNDSVDLLGIGRATSEIVGVAKELLIRLVGPMTDEAALLLGNEVKYFRVRREKQIEKLLEKTDRLLQERGIQPQPVKIEILIPIFDYSSLLEEDDELNKRWVELLTTAASGVIIQSNYPMLLSQLNILDVKILETMYLEVFRLKLSVDQLDKKGFSVRELQQEFAVIKEVILVSINKLCSLGLCNKTEFSTSRMIFGKALDKIFTKIAVGTGERYGLISLEPMGHDFIRACRSKTNDPVSGK